MNANDDNDDDCDHGDCNNNDGNGGDDNVAAAPIMNQGQRFNAYLRIRGLPPGTASLPRHRETAHIFNNKQHLKVTLHSHNCNNVLCLM